MKCKKCGYQLDFTDKFCTNCGKPVNELNMSNNGDNFAYQNMQTPSYSKVNTGSQIINNTPNNQQTMHNVEKGNDGYSFNQNYQASAKNKNSNSIMAVVVVVAIVVAIVAVVVALNSKKSSNMNPSDINNTNNKSTYAVSFDGFKFNIPDDLIYKESENYLSVGNQEETWFVDLEVMKLNFSQLKNNKNLIQTGCQMQGYTCGSATEKKINGVEFITFEITYYGENFLAAYAKINSMYTMAVTVDNQSDIDDNDLLEKAAQIISSVELISSSNNISVTQKPDMSIIISQIVN